MIRNVFNSIEIGASLFIVLRKKTPLLNLLYNSVTEAHDVSANG